MSRIYLLVEGQTEEAFINELLVAHYARLNLYLTPIIVSTSPGFRGGMTSYAKVRRQIERLCKQDAGAYVSTLFDLYALPSDFPGKSDAAFPTTSNDLQRQGKSRVSGAKASQRHCPFKLHPEFAGA